MARVDRRSIRTWRVSAKQSTLICARKSQQGAQESDACGPSDDI